MNKPLGKTARKRIAEELKTMTIEDPDYMIQQIDEHGEGLTKWEVNFIGDLVDGYLGKLSKKQIDIIQRIYDEKVNR